MCSRAEAMDLLHQRSCCLALPFPDEPTVEDPPHIQEEVEKARTGGFKMDLLGFGLVALAFGSLGVILNKGQETTGSTARFS